MSRQISDERKAAYYIGMSIAILGAISFASVFVSAFLHFGDSGLGPDFGKSLALRAFGGMALMILGGAIQGIARRGLAGSGVVLDPEQARDDLEPYTRMVEYKKFYRNPSPTTLVILEIPSFSNKLYPYTTGADQAAARKYLDALPKDVYSLGRSGSYVYDLDIARCIRQCMDLASVI